MKTWHYIAILAFLLTGGLLWYYAKPKTSTTAPLGYVDSFGLGLSPAEETELKGWIEHIKTSIKNNVNGWSEAGINAGATESGLTYENQIINSALYQMYATKKAITKDRYTALLSTLKSK